MIRIVKDMAEIDQLLLDRAWVTSEPDRGGGSGIIELVHYVLIDPGDEEHELVTPRRSRLGQILEAEIDKCQEAESGQQLGSSVEADSGHARPVRD